MDALFVFWITLIGLLVLIVYLDEKRGMLRDISIALRKPYSFGRVQLAWWTMIVIASFVAVLSIGKGTPKLDPSTLVLLGISSVTTAAARVIDVSDESNRAIRRSQDEGGDWFFPDILSDAAGVSIHRLQSVLFNSVIGIWFVTAVTYNLAHPTGNIDNIMPVLKDGDLILLGLSSGTYAALKTMENKSNRSSFADSAGSDLVQDETEATGEKGVG